MVSNDISMFHRENGIRAINGQEIVSEDVGMIMIIKNRRFTIVEHYDKPIKIEFWD